LGRLKGVLQNMARPKIWVSKSEWGRRVGLSPARVTELAKEPGFPVGRDGRVQAAAATAWYKSNVKGAAERSLLSGEFPQMGSVKVEAPANAGGSGAESFGLARARKEAALADKQERENRRRAGELLERRDVTRLHGDMIITAKTNLRGIGAKIAPDLAAESDAAKCEQMVTREIDEALQEISRWTPAAEAEPGGPETFREARTRKESALADQHELKARKLDGELVEISEVRGAITDHLAHSRSILLGLPGELCDRMAAEQDPIRCRLLLMERIREALTALAGMDTKYDEKNETDQAR
jgi:hypothetical protein